MSGHQEQFELDFDSIANRNKFEHGAFNRIRKQSLDPYNRIHSIAEDIDFVQIVHQHYPSYALLANLRCGAWYCDSRTNNGVAVHFKSADGHYNGWSFNLRRPNLHILPLIRNAGGICLVDSTRSGKSMPDSFSKTVPIWCCVINQTMKLRGAVRSDDWNVQLYTPPQCVSKQEHFQIESRITTWAQSLAKSSYVLPNFSKPLRPIWITPGTASFPTFDEITPFSPVICISASKRVEEGAERRVRGYSYVQGAGDDHENWSTGLTPEIFWTNKDELLNASEHEFPGILDRVVVESRRAPASSSREWKKVPTGIAHVGSLIAISSVEDMPGCVADLRNHQEVADMPIAFVIARSRSADAEGMSSNDFASTRAVHEVRIPTNKKSGERAFKASLPGSLHFISHHLRDRRQVCIACETGRDISVGIALVALQAFFDDRGNLDLDGYGHKERKADKDSIRLRLQWIIASRPEANPSRATLKRVNEFFMSPARPSSPLSDLDEFLDGLSETRDNKICRSSDILLSVYVTSTS